MPEMPAAKRGSDPAGNRQYANVSVFCLWCIPGERVLVGKFRRDRATAATTDHIERPHPTQPSNTNPKENTEMSNLKYELTDETRTRFGVTLHRIKALRDIDRCGVKAGDLGGWIEKETNLSHEGSAWVYGAAQVSGDALVSGAALVYGDALVYGAAQVYGAARVYGNALVSGAARVYGSALVSGDARVYGAARVSGSAWVSGNARVESSRDYIVVGPVGSEHRYVTIHRTTPTEKHTHAHQINAGCWSGTVDQLAERIAKPKTAWPDSGKRARKRWKNDYEAVIACALTRINEWNEVAK